MTYLTKQGDMFDLIAKNALGDEKFAPDVMKENPAYLRTQVFSGGVTLKIPDVETGERAAVLPPWKEAAG